MRGLRGRAGDGYGAPGRGYKGNVPGYADTWAKYLFRLDTYPKAGVHGGVGATPGPWDQNNLGRHMGLSRRSSARSPARSGPVLSCPALPR